MTVMCLSVHLCIWQQCVCQMLKSNWALLNIWRQEVWVPVKHNYVGKSYFPVFLLVAACILIYSLFLSKGAISPSKPMKVIWFTMILYNLESSIRDVRPFCHPLFCHSSVVKYTSYFSCSSDHVMRLDYQILRRLPPP